MTQPKTKNSRLQTTNFTTKLQPKVFYLIKLFIAVLILVGYHEAQTQMHGFSRFKKTTQMHE